MRAAAADACKTPFGTLLIANRGEIALRVIRTARRMGIRTVAVYSEADRDAPHVRAADESVPIGGAAPAESYLNIPAIIAAARASGAEAVHPGYGFLSENPAFAEACAEAGLIFVGPSAEAMREMGDKARAKAVMAAAGVPCVPGYDGADQGDVALLKAAQAIGWPVMIKAVAGGGGRGMRLVGDEVGFAGALAAARAEARLAFGDDRVLLEKAVAQPRHVEIQVFADRSGNAVHLGERDCSVQRRHQKLIEEAPSPAVSPALRESMGAAAVRAAQAIGYEGAGTLEFLLAGDDWYFMEMNTRLQVEHPVTEAITGLDLVELQLRIAAGEDLSVTQGDVRFQGHAIEVRLCAEDPEAGFAPDSGRIALWRPATGVRTDHGLATGSVIPPDYDSMVAKVIAHGPDREAARRALVAALGETVFLGPRSNRAFLMACLDHETFAAGGATTAFIDTHAADLTGTGDAEAAALLAACLIQAAQETGLVHGFPAPLRLERGGDMFDLRVIAGAWGRATAECVASGRSLSAVVTGADGAVRHYSVDGVDRSARLVTREGRVFLHAGGESWDFSDRTLGAPQRIEDGSDGRLVAAIGGRVVAVEVAEGDRVEAGQVLVTLEAMKLQHIHASAVAGRVVAVHVGVGDQVEAHRLLVEVTPD